jgi:hypothetical protein
MEYKESTRIRLKKFDEESFTGTKVENGVRFIY